MTLAQEIARHLPLLRRYARALIGSQKSGDSYVALLLETLIADPGAVSNTSDLRLSLYRTLSRLWSSVPINLEPGSRQDWEASASERLAAIAPRPRQSRASTWTRRHASSMQRQARSPICWRRPAGKSLRRF